MKIKIKMTVITLHITQHSGTPCNFGYEIQMSRKTCSFLLLHSSLPTWLQSNLNTSNFL